MKKLVKKNQNTSKTWAPLKEKPKNIEYYVRQVVAVPDESDMNNPTFVDLAHESFSLDPDLIKELQRKNPISTEDMGEGVTYKYFGPKDKDGSYILVEKDKDYFPWFDIFKDWNKK